MDEGRGGDAAEGERLVGAEVARRVRDLADAGVDDFHASIFVATDNAEASVARTRELLKSLVGAV